MQELYRYNYFVICKNVVVWHPFYVNAKLILNVECQRKKIIIRVTYKMYESTFNQKMSTLYSHDYLYKYEYCNNCSRLGLAWCSCRS